MSVPELISEPEGFVSSAWSRDKRRRFEDGFYAFLEKCYVNSKDAGFISLGSKLHYGQRLFIENTLDGLEDDKHQHFMLKSRQLGISTIARALSIFYIGIHKGLKGALVFDTASNRDEARSELEVMIEDLPKSLKFPAVKKTNREGLTLINNSKILFKHAGIKKSAASGTLGRSVGLTMSHASEICSYNDIEGLESYQNSLSEFNPNRLFLWESTARGWNIWKDMWDGARADPDHCVATFIGWWARQDQKIAQGSRDWEKYGAPPPTQKEQKKIDEVRDRYGFVVTQEALAWFRRKIDPSRKGADEAYDVSEDSYKIQEQPWTEDEAFQQAGSIFFAPETLTEISTKNVSRHFKPYMFMPGAEFSKMRVYEAPNARNTDFKVWEEPEHDAVYEVGVDPAYGENPLNDRSCIQVLRCYADGCDQVAEYTSPLITTNQLAWVLASILGWYGGGANAQVKYALELNGPGTAVFTELRALKQRIEQGYESVAAQERGIKDIFRNVRTYIYTRPDSMTTGQAYHIKTNLNLKVMFLERMRDAVTNNYLRLRSAALVDEMKYIAREGDSISAAGSKKDDRVMAAAFALHSWESGSRKQLVMQKRTREAEAARKRMSISDQVGLFNTNMLTGFFEQKRRVRVMQQKMAIQQRWRYR